MSLADDVVEVAGPHPGRERSLFGQQLLEGSLEAVVWRHGSGRAGRHRATLGPGQPAAGRYPGRWSGRIRPAADLGPYREAYHHRVRGIARVVRSPSPLTLDGALALGLTAVNVAAIVPYRRQLHPLGLAIFLVVLESVPLIARRSRPVASFVVIGTARVAYDLARLGWAPLPLSVGIAVYTVADRCSPAVRRVVAPLLVLGIVTSQFASPHNEPYEITVASLFFAAAWVAGVASRTRRAYTHEVELRARRAEADQDSRAAQAAAGERARIARELHDVVAHHVSLIAVQAEAAGSLLPDRPVEAAGSVDIIGATARQALTELRRLLGVLRSPGEPAETTPSASVGELAALVEHLRQAGLDVDFTVSGTPRRLSAAVDLTAYRIVQEALTNAVRHAPDNQVQVQLSYQADHVSVSVADMAGKGAGSAAPITNGHSATSGGFGLAGVTERVTSCGGTLTVGPTPAGGFAVLARLPAP